MTKPIGQLNIAAAFMLVSVFVSCNNSAENEPGVVAEYISDTEDNVSGFKLTLTFYDDDSWEVVLDDAGSATAAKDFEGKVIWDGTYTGDPSKDGPITISITHIFVGDSVEEVPSAAKDAYTDLEFTISKGFLGTPFGNFERK